MVKKKGMALPPKQVFKTCFDNNPDGCGYMYVNNGKVIIKKGYMGYKHLYKDIKRLTDKNDINVVVHFRIGTQGKNDAKTTHPYPITSNTDYMQKLYYETDLAVVHNGIIYGYEDKTRPDLNDTQIFIRDVLSVLQELNKDFYKNENAITMLEDITSSKLVFLDKDDTLSFVGNFINDNGILYSNYTYKETRYTYTTSNTSNTYTTSNTSNTYTTSNGYKYDYNTYERYPLMYGDYIEYSNGDIEEVRASDKYEVDSNGTLWEVSYYSPDKLKSSNVRIYDSNYEEIMV